MPISSKVGVGGVPAADSIVNSQINSTAAIDATKIANGLVTSTEYQYLDGVTSAIQTQLGTKAPLASPSFTTPTLGVASATSVNFGGTALSQYVEGTFTPTVTLVGGAANTVPVYSINTGRYTRIGNRVFVDMYLTGDGGNEGAGTGVINIALPIAANANQPSGIICVGSLILNTAIELLYCVLTGGSSTVALKYQNLIANAIDATGSDQSNTTRSLRLQFSYEA